MAPNKLNYFAFIQRNQLHCVNYMKHRYKNWRNINGHLLTSVTCHPIEELVATGDVTGKILLYRKIFSKCEPMTTLYHWHHTPVNCVTFTLSGSHFYSGGQENVLVQWNMHEKEDRNYVPRMWGTPVHVVIGAENQKVAVATNDNGIQILNPQNNVLAVIQNFTWIPNDKTNVPKFPIGLKVCPRTTSLVMNGRIGHLQFYSTNTRNLLFNVNTDMNCLSPSVCSIYKF